MVKIAVADGAGARQTSRSTTTVPTPVVSERDCDSGRDMYLELHPVSWYKLSKSLEVSEVM